MDNNKHIIGINAFNIRAGGGVTHLIEFLSNANPEMHNIQKVVIWASSDVLNKITDKHWLVKKYTNDLNKGFLLRYYWILFKSKKDFMTNNINLLFIPGGSYLSNFRPFVTLNQNLLPFENREILRFGISLLTLKFIFLKFIQKKTNEKANGIIYLTDYAKKIVNKDQYLQFNKKLNTIIPHGVNDTFTFSPDKKIFKDKHLFTKNNPCKLLYVSTIEVYKHQWKIIEGVYNLRKEGYNIKLILVGNPGSGTKRFNKTINKYDPKFDFIEYHSSISYDQIKKFYIEADIGVFASSCETFGMVLTESMLCSLPLIVSNRSAIPEVVGDGGLYFNPEDVLSFSNAAKEMINSVDLRKKLATISFQRVKKFSWKESSYNTFNFFKSVINQYNHVQK